jgi:hypothetical protein
VSFSVNKEKEKMKHHEAKEGLVKFIHITEVLGDILREASCSEPDEKFVQGKVSELNDLVADSDGNCFVAESAVGDNDHMLIFHFDILSVPTPAFLSGMLGDDDETDE